MSIRDWQLWGLVIVLAMTGCSAQRAHLRQMATRRPSVPGFCSPGSSRQASPPSSEPSPPDNYAPTPQEEIPPPPSGALLNGETGNGEEVSGLKKAKVPPVLLRPVRFGLGETEELVSLEVPQPR